MENKEGLCDLNDTWEDALEEFKAVIAITPTWKCVGVENADKEIILSAPEIMDPQTDTGYGCEKINSLSFLLKSGEIPDPSTLKNEKTLVDIMDFLHERELHYLEGNSLVQSYLCFPYFLALNELEKAHPVLHAYCSAMLCTLECIRRAAAATTICGDEEFSPVPPELSLLLNTNLGKSVEDLEALASQPDTSPAVALRLRFRKNFLFSLFLFENGTTKGDMLKACDLCEEAANWLRSSPEFQRTAEPEVDPRVVREKEIPFWVSTITPVASIPRMPFSDVSVVYQTLLSHLSSLKLLFSLPSLSSITEFIEDIASQSPLLIVRCITVILLFGHDPTESFLFGLPLHQRLLETLVKNCGAPLYLKIFERNSQMVESVVRYRVQKTMDPLKVTPTQLNSLREQTIDMMQRWVAEAGKHYLEHLEIMLCNQGLAYRRLMNVIPGLAEFQDISYFMDSNIFLFRLPGGNLQLQEHEASRVSRVLTLWASEVMLHAMELIVNFQIGLDLLKDGEIIPALWYLSMIYKAKRENTMLLSSPGATVVIPENRINKKRVPLYNLCLSTRTQGEIDFLEKGMLEVNRCLADAQFLAACIAEKKGLMNFTSTGSVSLTTAENTFNHRYAKCFGCVRHPAFASYRLCMATKPVINGENIKSEVQKASDLALSAAEKTRALLKTPTRPLTDIRKQILEKTERSARALVACLALLGEEETTAEFYECRKSCLGLPHFLSFPVYKKKQASE